MTPKSLPKHKPGLPPKPRRVNRPGRAATPRQDDIRAALASLTATLGRGPSTGEIAAALGISRQSAARQLAALEAKGLVADEPRVVRSGRWTLTGPR